MGTSLKKVAKKAKDYKYVLLVMRHAKTEPFGDGGDAGRELTDKGRKQAKAVAKGLAAHKMVPTRIACSSATRARQTCDRMLKVFGDDPKVDYRQSLYEGGVQSVFDLRFTSNSNDSKNSCRFLKISCFPVPIRLIFSSK